MNFFRGIPSELEEWQSLRASQWQILWRIFIPISKPSLATIILFSLINHWNSWFDGLIIDAYHQLSASVLSSDSGHFHNGIIWRREM